MHHCRGLPVMLTGSNIKIEITNNKNLEIISMFSHLSGLDPKNISVHLQRMSVRKEHRVLKNGHKPCVVWLTGLSGSGKSSTADALEKNFMRLVITHTRLMATMSGRA